MHEIAPFKKISWGCMPPNPHCNSSRHADPKSKKIYSWAPPLRNPAYAPVVNVVIIECLTQIMSYMHCIP